MCGTEGQPASFPSPSPSPEKKQVLNINLILTSSIPPTFWPGPTTPSPPQVPCLPAWSGRLPEPPIPQPSAHPPFLTRPCCPGTQF